MKSEMLGYHLERNLPDFHVSIRFIPQEEWTKFVSNQFQLNGWNVRGARDCSIKKPEQLKQLIWYDSGELIGNTEDFLVHIKRAYNFENPIEASLLKQIAVENALLCK
jgi:hypothetical protein